MTVLNRSAYVASARRAEQARCSAWRPAGSLRKRSISAAASASLVKVGSSGASRARSSRGSLITSAPQARASQMRGFMASAFAPARL